MHANKRFPGIYSTTVLRPYNKFLSEIREFLDTSVITKSGSIRQVAYGVFSPNRDVTDLTAFKHPVYSEKTESTLIDLRPFLTNDDRVRDVHNRDLLVKRGLLEETWAMDGDAYQNVAIPLASFFGHWVSQTIGSRNGLAEDDKMLINIFMFVYYMVKLRSTDDLATMDTTDFTTGLLRPIQRFTKLNFTDVERIMSNSVFSEVVSAMLRSPANALDEVLKGLRKVVSVNVLPLDASSLIIVMSQRQWLSDIDSQLLVGTSLEHPPSLVYLIDTAITNRLFGKTNIGTTVNAATRRLELGAVNHFVKSLGE